MSILMRPWKRRVLVGVLVFSNLMLASMFLAESKLAAEKETVCCSNCICWCHTNSTACNSLGTGMPCTAGSGCN